MTKIGDVTRMIWLCWSVPRRDRKISAGIVIQILLSTHDNMTITLLDRRLVLSMGQINVTHS